MKKYFIMLLGLVLAAALSGFAYLAPANATDGQGEPCVPSEAWTEVIEHEAVTHVVHHDAVTHVVHHDAVTHVVHHEGTPAGPDLWWNWSPNKDQGPFEGPPAFPNDERGTWQGPHENGGPDQDTFGTFNSSNSDNGRASWFHRDHGTPGWDAWDETVVDQEAYDETVTDTEAYDETVVDEEAWTETIEHPAVTCEGEQPDPLVQVSSSTSYECGDDFQTTETVTTTTEYVLVEGEWVLGEPVSETVTETADHAVVPCDTEEPPVDNPPTNNPPTVVVHNAPPAPKQPQAVPTVIDAGL